MPTELKALNNWVCWKDKSKTPLNPYTLNNAKVNDANTWADYDAAFRRVHDHTAAGVGFIIGEGFTVIDLDHVIDIGTGKATDEALDIVKKLGSYTEVSMSGAGIHIFMKSDFRLPNGKKSQSQVPLASMGGFELYTGNRYIAMTGTVFTQYPCDKIRQVPADVIASIYNDIIKRDCAAPDHGTASRSDMTMPSKFELPTVIETGMRNSTLTSYAGSLCRTKALHNETAEQIIEEVKEAVKTANYEHCPFPLTDGELENTVFKAIEKYAKQDCKERKEEWLMELLHLKK